MIDAPSFRAFRDPTFSCSKIPMPNSFLTLPNTLLNERITLKRPTWDDMPFIRALWSDEETMRAVGGVVTLTDEQARNWFARKIDPGSGTDGYWLIYDAANQPIGEISFHRLVRETMTADFNLKIKHSERGKGYARQAMRLVFDYWFGEFGGKVMNDDVALDNNAGQQALLKFGFEHDASITENFRLVLTREHYHSLRRQNTDR
jgi:RimJ/RimL family protein N-acetyltransferase